MNRLKGPFGERLIVGTVYAIFATSPLWLYLVYLGTH